MYIYMLMYNMHKLCTGTVPVLQFLPKYQELGKSFKLPEYQVLLYKDCVHSIQ